MSIDNLDKNLGEDFDPDIEPADAAPLLGEVVSGKLDSLMTNYKGLDSNDKRGFLTDLAKNHAYLAYVLIAVLLSGGTLYWRYFENNSVGDEEQVVRDVLGDVQTDEIVKLISSGEITPKLEESVFRNDFFIPLSRSWARDYQTYSLDQNREDLANSIRERITQEIQSMVSKLRNNYPLGDISDEEIIKRVVITAESNASIDGNVDSNQVLSDNVAADVEGMVRPILGNIGIDSSKVQFNSSGVGEMTFLTSNAGGVSVLNEGETIEAVSRNLSSISSRYNVDTETARTRFERDGNRRRLPTAEQGIFDGSYASARGVRITIEVLTNPIVTNIVKNRESDRAQEIVTVRYSPPGDEVEITSAPNRDEYWYRDFATVPERRRENFESKAHPEPKTDPTPPGAEILPPSSTANPNPPVSGQGPGPQSPVLDRPISTANPNPPVSGQGPQGPQPPVLDRPSSTANPNPPVVGHGPQGPQPPVLVRPSNTKENPSDTNIGEEKEKGNKKKGKTTKGRNFPPPPPPFDRENLKTLPSDTKFKGVNTFRPVLRPRGSRAGTSHGNGRPM